ncbi:MAG: exosome complex exonuclease Rrp41 [Candidatus Heimdallarchaeota archaeon]
MKSDNQEKPKQLIKDGIRLDGRTAKELRPVHFEVDVLNRADGSALIEMGRNKIVVAIYGPRELHPKHYALPDRAFVRCSYRMATFSVEDRKSPAPARREIEISKVIREALVPAIFVEYFPRTTIDIYIEVLQADGGSRCASIDAASLALANAGIPLRDLISAVAVGKVDGQIVLDLSDVEDKEGEGDLPIAIMPRNKRVTLLQLDGTFTQAEFEEAFNLAIEGINQIYELQRKTIAKKYADIRQEVKADLLVEEEMEED